MFKVVNIAGCKQPRQQEGMHDGDAAPQSDQTACFPALTQLTHLLHQLVHCLECPQAVAVVLIEVGHVGSIQPASVCTCWGVAAKQGWDNNAVCDETCSHSV